MSSFSNLDCGTKEITFVYFLRSFWSSVVLICTYVACEPVFAIQSATTLETVLQGIANIESQFANYRIMCAQDSSISTQSKTLSEDHQQVELLRSKMKRRWEIESVLDDGTKQYSAWCRNPSRNTFSVSRIGDESWHLERLYPNVDPPAGTSNVSIFRFASIAYGIYGIPFSEIAKHPTFKLKEVRDEQSESGRSVVIYFDYLPNPTESKLMGGFVRCDVNRSFAIVEAKCAFGNSGETVSQNTVYGSEGDFIPKSTLIKTDIGKAIATEKADYQFVSLKSPSDSEFTLSHFGIPEIQADRNYLIWICVAAVITVITIVYVRRLRNRSNAV